MTNLPPSAGVIGWPVAHSKSPLIHRFWLAKLGIDGDYGRFPVAPGRLGAAIRALPAMGLRGVNVTVPHKVAVMPFLDRVAPIAVRVGAVNTVVVEGDAVVGYNSDVDGVAAALPGIDGASTPCLIGAGGAARAVLARLEPGRVGGILVVARNRTKAQGLLDEFGLRGTVCDFADTAAIAACDSITNATTLGMTGQPPIPDSILAALGGADAAAVPVFDMVYSPRETPLLDAARAGGHPAVDGLTMLIGQAAAAFGLFFGATAPREHDAELRALLIA